MTKKEFLFVLKSFLIWKVGLILVLSFAIKFLANQEHFLGGGMGSYLANPYLWAWANFDGEHYISIAQMGYQPLTYFFFPVYPMIIKLIGSILGTTTTAMLATVGLIVSNTAFFIALVGLYKLIRLDFSEKVARVATILLLVFPTSFYFGSVYTEGLFLALTVWCFYFARKGAWLSAGVLAMISSATRITGLILFPVLLIEAWKVDRGFKLKHLPILLAPLGILLYMYYLKVQTGDPLDFFNNVGIFGGQRSEKLILLPQVIYRYFVKIIPSLGLTYFPTVFVTYMEALFGILFLGLSVVSFYKLRLSYAVYLVLGYLMPTLSGSFSSLPRYVIVLFPAFILSSLFLTKATQLQRILVFLVLLVGLIFSTAFFTRGYWLS